MCPDDSRSVSMYSKYLLLDTRHQTTREGELSSPEEGGCAFSLSFLLLSVFTCCNPRVVVMKQLKRFAAVLAFFILVFSFKCVGTVRLKVHWA